MPDELAKVLAANRAELPQRALEAIVNDMYRGGKISHAQVGEILGLDRWKTDAFLKESGAFRPNEANEFANDLAALRSLTGQ